MPRPGPRREMVFVRLDPETIRALDAVVAAQQPAPTADGKPLPEGSRVTRSSVIRNLIERGLGYP